jgi:hypothetical protein
MDTLSLVLLGVIALSSLAQAVSLVGVAVEGRRIARRIQAVEERMEREVQPALRDAARLARRIADVSDLAALQAQRASDVLDSAATKVGRTGSVLSAALLPSVARAATVVSLARTVLDLMAAFRRGRTS